MFQLLGCSILWIDDDIIMGIRILLYIYTRHNEGLTELFYQTFPQSSISTINQSSQLIHYYNNYNNLNFDQLNSLTKHKCQSTVIQFGVSS